MSSQDIPTPLREAEADTGSQAPVSSGQSMQKKRSPNLQALAEAVLRLLKKEARLERERQGWRNGK